MASATCIKTRKSTVQQGVSRERSRLTLIISISISRNKAHSLHNFSKLIY